MASFGSMPALSTGAAPGSDAVRLDASGMDAFDPNMAFDESLLDPVHGLPNLPYTPTGYEFETFGTTFDDPFSYPARGFDGTTIGALDADAYNGEVLSPQDLDNKLLGFGPPIPGKATLIGEAGQFVEPNMTGELYGMFFVAEDVFGADHNTGRPLELTCYRRNLWQISGQITLPRHVAHYVDDQGRQEPAVELAASISAIESIEGKATEIITIPWKSSNAALVAEEPKMPSPPPIVSLDLSSGQEVDGSHVSVPVSWKRLQFKHATANNGRRKGLQQHYVVQINLLVKTKNGEHLKVAEIQSGPVIVRGRSPRNFDGRRDVPLSGDRRAMERRATDGSYGPAGGSSKQHQNSQHAKEERPETAQNSQRYHSVGNAQTNSEWSTPRPFPTPSPQHPSKKMAISSPSLQRPPVPSWGALDSSSVGMGNSFVNNYNNNSNNNIHTPAASASSAATRSQRSTTAPAAPQTLPINLSLSEDERSPNRSNSADSAQSPQFTKTSASHSASGQQGHAASGSQNATLTSPLEPADMLYEYFPLSLDDWMPPVDAIYRPHVVHHIVIPPEVKAQQMRSKTKRYFAAE